MTRAGQQADGSARASWSRSRLGDEDRITTDDLAAASPAARGILERLCPRSGITRPPR